MKRTVLFLMCFCLFASFVLAGPVDPQRALQIAKEFVPQSSAVKKAPKKGETTPTSNIVYTHKMPKSGRDAFYIVNVGDAFVLVSADDVAHQILGYSFDKGFPVAADGTVQLPPHVKSFFDDLAAQMEAAIETEPNRAADDDWTGARKTARRAPSNLPDSVGPLLTTTWDQGQYYNALCPEDANGPDGHVWTGCVATAMAQIIKYWGEPVHGRGIHSYDTRDYGTLEVNFAESNYDFSNMPDVLTGESTAEQVNAVAKLMYDCGVAVNMGYTAGESGAFNQEARAGLINYFYFSPDLSFAEKSYFSNEEWNNLLRQNLAANRPVYYSGEGTGGHAFVCDGYKADDYYHFNFGWGGFADGWFQTSSVTPSGSNFNSSQSAIVDIVPDNTGIVILGQMQGTSTFIVDEPLEFYHLMGHNKYEGSYYDNSCSNMVMFLPSDPTKQLITDIVEFNEQSVTIFDGRFEEQQKVLLRFLSNDIQGLDDSPIISTKNAFWINYDGDISYAGFKLYLSQNNEYRKVSNIKSIVDTTSVSLSWVENGNALQWNVEYGPKGFKNGKGTIVTVDTPSVKIDNLNPYNLYDFYISPTSHNSWYGPIRLKTDLSYWQDIVTTEPDGCIYENDSNVIVSTPEQLTWVLHNSSDKNIILANDIDLGGHRWKPVINFQCNFNGNNHSISNLLIREETNVQVCSGFFKLLDYHQRINNVVFVNPVVFIKKDKNSTGVLAGSVSSFPIIENCCVIGGEINCSSRELGALIGSSGAVITNSFTNTIIYNNWINYNTNNTGGLIGENRGNIINCYSASKIYFEKGWHGLIVGYNDYGQITKCYGKDSEDNLVGYNSGQTIIRDTTRFDAAGILQNEITYDDSTYNCLIDVLNMEVRARNDGTWRLWQTDNTNINNGYPILDKMYTVIVPNVRNLHAKNIEYNKKNAIRLEWDSSENASSYIIKCENRDKKESTLYFRTDSTVIFLSQELCIGDEYIINVRAICNEKEFSGWGDGIIHIYDLPYWTDIVTELPNGYKEDANGNVYISSADGLAWFASCVNGLNKQNGNDFHGRIINLMSDINLEQYRWKPIGNNNFTFSGYFDGHGHTIKDLHINERDDNIGLFGYAKEAKFCNFSLLNGDIKGLSKVGSVCGYYTTSWERLNPEYGEVMFESCNVINTNILGTYYVGGICGCLDPFIEGLAVSNISTSGNIFAVQFIGGLIGDCGQDGYKVQNCFSTARLHINLTNVINTSYDGTSGGMSGYMGGLVGSAYRLESNNCYFAGCVEDSSVAFSVSGILFGNIQSSAITNNYGLCDNSKQLVALLTDIRVWNNNILFLKEENECLLLEASTIEGNSYTDLVAALNAWVDANNSEGQYRHWVADTENVNGGYPIFAPIYTLTYKVDGEVYKTSSQEVGAALSAIAEPTKEGYTFGGWSELPETMPNHDIEVTGSFYLYGDVNTDTKVNVVDVVDIARFVVDTPSDNFREKLADLNGSGYVNIADAVVLVNHIAGDQNIARMATPKNSTYNYESCDLRLIASEENNLSLTLTGDVDFTAFQFEVDVPEGIDIAAMRINSQRKDGHQLIFNKVADNLYRVAALSMFNAVFKGNDGELLSISLEGMGSVDVCIHDIHFVTTNGTDVIFDNLYINGNTTGIVDIHVKENAPIYDLQGRRHSTLQRGTNIVGNKKIIVK